MSFGERIKKRRDELSLTQEDVCALFNDKISRQSISKWERDETYPEAEKLLLLSKIYDISLDEMFADEMAYLRRNDNKSSDLDRYPGLLVGLKVFAERIKELGL